MIGRRLISYFMAAAAATTLSTTASPAHAVPVQKTTDKDFWEALFESDNKPMLGYHPISIKDVIPLADNVRAVGARYILKTGIIPMETGEQKGLNHYIEWGSNDPYTNAIRDTQNHIINVVRNDDSLQALLKKKTWSSSDRYMWELELSQLVGDRVKQIPGLSEYRTENTEKSDSPIRKRRINDLSEDMKSKGKSIEFDCEQMSITQIVIMQSIEDKLLPPPQKGTGAKGLKFASQYFYTGGAMKAGYDHQGGGHAFIISSASGNIIESTLNRKDQYYRETNGSFVDFLSGKTLVDFSGTAYGARWAKDDDHIIKQRQKAIEKNDLDILGTALFSKDAFTADALTEAIAIRDLRDARKLLRFSSEPTTVELPGI